MFTDSGDLPIYKPSIIHPEDRKAIDAITGSKNWDYKRFKSTLIALGTVGNGEHVPAYNRPDSIHVQGWREFIDDLNHRSDTDNVEYSRGIFVDHSKQSLFFSDKIYKGNYKSARLILDSPPSRPSSTPIGSIHTHPGNEGSAFGFSDADYNVFLTDKRQLYNMPTENITKRVDSLKKEFFDFPRTFGMPAEKRIMEFNKKVCVEFGLTLYKASPQDRDLLSRIEVTH